MGKPIRFDLKLWCLCRSNGYLYTFVPYGGKTSSYENQLGLGENVVHHIFFANFFFSYKLFCLLKEKDFFLQEENCASKRKKKYCGTIKKQRNWLMIELSVQQVTHKMFVEHH